MDHFIRLMDDSIRCLAFNVNNHLYAFNCAYSCMCPFTSSYFLSWVSSGPLDKVEIFLLPFFMTECLLSYCSCFMVVSIYEFIHFLLFRIINVQLHNLSNHKIASILSGATFNTKNIILASTKSTKKELNNYFL